MLRNFSRQLLRFAHSVRMSISKPEGFPELMKFNGGMPE